ncbi:MAG: hypothetical protein HWN79_11125 [Candidatus Lokiarchaeota archaeon]|nr:hypothetical protein [Candidatus Lokiarchaeota archaeon]
MLNRERYNLLTGLVIIKTNISFSLLIIDIILILQINNVIEIGYIVNLLLINCLISLELGRIMTMVISGTLTIRIRKIDIKIKAVMLASLFIGIALSTIFLIRLFIFAWFVPSYSFACTSLITNFFPKNE